MSETARIPDNPTDLLTSEQLAALNADLSRLAKLRRSAEAGARNIPVGSPIPEQAGYEVGEL